MWKNIIIKIIQKIDKYYNTTYIYIYNKKQIYQYTSNIYEKTIKEKFANK